MLVPLLRGVGLGLLSTIFPLYRENHRPVASHQQTLSHNIVSRTPHLSGPLLILHEGPVVQI